jgi:succinylglutamate desuccinylase
MIQSYSFSGIEDGPHLLFFGAIHGNEPCGTKAIERILKQIESNNILIKKGRITFVPVCNPRAFEKNKRYSDINLNRIFKPHVKPTHYEEMLANELILLIEKCDCLIDLHSVTAASPPFCFLDYVTDKNLELVKIINVPHIVTGWSDIYNDTNNSSTQSYAHQLGKAAVTIECGQHDDPQAIDHAFHYIISALERFAIIDVNKYQETYPLHSTIYHLQNVIYKTADLDMTQDFINFHPVEKGTALAKSPTQTIVAPSDGAVVMPNPNVKVGEDLFYFATSKAL